RPEGAQARYCAAPAADQPKRGGDAEAAIDEELPGIEVRRQANEYAGEAPAQAARQHAERAGEEAGLRRDGGRLRHRQRPIHTGGRFSAKARGPSRASSEARTAE